MNEQTAKSLIRYTKSRVDLMQALAENQIDQQARLAPMAELEKDILDKKLELAKHREELALAEAELKLEVMTAATWLRADGEEVELKNEPARKAAYEAAILADPQCKQIRALVGQAEAAIDQLQLELSQHQRVLSGCQYSQRNLETQARLLLGV